MVEDHSFTFILSNPSDYEQLYIVRILHTICVCGTTLPGTGSFIGMTEIINLIMELNREF